MTTIFSETSNNSIMEFSFSDEDAMVAVNHYFTDFRNPPTDVE